MGRQVTTADLREQITIQARTAGQDGHGQEAQTWTDLATVWAQAEPLRGRDFFAAGQMQQAVSTRFRMRWRDDITGAHRVLWRGEPYEVEGQPIDVDGRRQTLELMCLTGVRDGL